MAEFEHRPWHRPDVARYVAGAVIVSDGRALLLRRRAEEVLGGIWELPSGCVEDGETLRAAIRREVREETGLEVTAVGKVLGWFDYVSSSGRVTRQGSTWRWRCPRPRSRYPSTTPPPGLAPASLAPAR